MCECMCVLSVGRCAHVWYVYVCGVWVNGMMYMCYM